jgi:CRP/FNR family transcriptional regulator, cyclic AMP receptor protein
MARGRKDGKLEALKSVPLFAGMSKRDLAALGKVADELDVQAGKELIGANEPGRQFFVLLEGEAVVRRNGRKVNTLGAGDFFGEIALLSDRPTTASVTMTSAGVVVVITRASFNRLLRESPALQLKVLATVVERLPGD